MFPICSKTALMTFSCFSMSGCRLPLSCCTSPTSAQINGLSFSLSSSTRTVFKDFLQSSAALQRSKLLVQALKTLASDIRLTSSRDANAILKINANKDEGDWGYSREFYKFLHPALAPKVAPGKVLDGMNRVMIQNLAASVEALKPTRTKATWIGQTYLSRDHLGQDRSCLGAYEPIPRL